jgi:hypothetical protein
MDTGIVFLEYCLRFGNGNDAQEDGISGVRLRHQITIISTVMHATKPWILPKLKKSFILTNQVI